MAKVIINFPIVVECDVKSFGNSDESWAGLDKTDAVELSNIVFPGKLNLPADFVALITE
jgi:hypothetical protein